MVECDAYNPTTKGKYIYLKSRIVHTGHVEGFFFFPAVT